MSAPIPELILLVAVLFIGFPAAVAVWDEYRWMRYRQHKERWHDLLLTTRKERGYE